MPSTPSRTPKTPELKFKEYDTTSLSTTLDAAGLLGSGKKAISDAVSDFNQLAQLHQSMNKTLEDAFTHFKGKSDRASMDAVNTLRQHVNNRMSAKKNSTTYNQLAKLIPDSEDKEDNQQIAKINFDLKKLSFQLMASKEDLVATKIKSPVNGNLINFNVEIGSILKKGEKLATILVAKQNEVEISVRSEKVSKIRVGSNVEIKNENDDIFYGKVRSIVGLENVKTGTRVIRITLPKNFPDKLNVPGRKFQVKVFMEDSSTRLVFPKDALIVERNKKYVFVVERNLAKKTSIKIGKSFQNQIEVIEGLIEGNKVVIKGNETLRNNQKVRIKKNKSSKNY